MDTAFSPIFISLAPNPAPAPDGIRGGASFSLFQPLVGSEIYNCLKKEGKLENIDLNKCEYSKPSIVPEGFKNINEVKKLQKKAILEFYLRPKILSKFVIENMTIDQIKELGVID